MADDASQVAIMKSMVDQLQQEKVSLLMAIESLVVRNEKANADTRQQFIKTILELERELEASRQESAQARVIGNSSGALPYSIRVNTTRKRLEYINKDSAVDDNGNPWSDELWSPVLGGDFVEYTP